MLHPVRKKARGSCGNRPLTNVWGEPLRPSPGSTPAGSSERTGIAARPKRVAIGSSVENRHDLERAGIDHDDLVPDEDELISAPIRINGYDLRRQRMERHFVRNAGADCDREVDVGDWRNVLFP